MPLKPQNIVQAAEADLVRRRRNMERAKEPEPWTTRAEGSMEPYAFHRNHVRKATSALELIELALAHPDIVLGKHGEGEELNEEPKSAKANTLMIYRDVELLTEAREWLLRKSTVHDTNLTDCIDG